MQLKVSGTGRRAAAAASVLAIAAGGAVIARADDSGSAATQAAGGLSVSPAKVERRAVAGAANVVTVANRSDRALTVAVSARPWVQSGSGLVTPNRRSTLADVAISDASFTLSPGDARNVTVSLRTVPAAGALYGALEIVGLPRDIARRKGVVTGYRLVGALRYTPATRTYSLKAGAAKLVGEGSKRVIALTVRNAGNTIDPVSGTVRVRGPLGTRQGSIKATRILPGTSVAVPLVSTRGLPAGSYTASVTLRQGDQRINVSKRIRVRR